MQDMIKEAIAESMTEDRKDRSKKRQRSRAKAVELASEVQHLEGLALTIIEEVKHGNDIDQEVVDDFRAVMAKLATVFEKVFSK